MIEPLDERLVITAGIGEEEGGHGNADYSDTPTPLAEAR
jgi:hypothetical protein